MTTGTTPTTEQNTTAQTEPGADDIAPEDKALWDEFDRLEGEKPAEDDAGDETPPAAAAAPAAAAPADDETGNAAPWGDQDGTGKDDEAAAAAPAASADPVPAKPPKGAGKPAPAAAAPTPDPYENWTKLSPEEKAATADRLGTTPQAIDVEVKSNRGRIRSMQQRINELERRVGTAAPAATTTAPAKAGTAPADPASVLDQAFQSEKWKKFAEEYGEVAAPLADTLRDIFGPVIADQANMKSVTSRVETNLQQADQQARDAIVLEAHPDFADVIGNKDFGAWALTQPESIKAVLRKNANGIADPEEAVRVVTTYKLDRGIPITPPPAPTPAPETPPAAPAGNPQSSAGNLSPRRQAQLASAATPSSRSPGVVQGGEPQTEEEAWKHWEKVEEREARRRA